MISQGADGQGVPDRATLLSLPRRLLRPGGATADYGRFYLIDLSRGLAAIAILFWHYQMLYYTAPGFEYTEAMRRAQPLYSVFAPLYSYGWMAVQYFWAVSGFVFCAVYTSAPATTRSFAVNRFARLYPLHFLTLLAVAALQIANLRIVGHTQIYENTDAYHFLLNLFFLSGWGFEHGWSFNGPVWSVSLELLFYFGFWITLPYLYRFGIALPLALSGAFFVAHGLDLPFMMFWSCGAYFFAGVAVFIFFDRTHNAPYLLIGSAVALVAFAILLLVLQRFFGFAQLIVVVAVVLAAAAGERGWLRQLARKLKWVGDSTYGTYLWHVPVQLVALLVLDGIVGTRAMVAQPWFLLGFIAVVMLIARASYVYIENPARSFFRRFARDPKAGPIVEPPASSLAAEGQDLAP